MTVTLITARINDVFQYRNFPDMTLEEAEALNCQWYYTPSTGYWVKTNYKFVQLITAGWAGGARLRTKNLPLDRALAYVNKLFSGNWIDVDNYNTMYTLIDFLLQDHTPYWEDIVSRPGQGALNQYALVVEDGGASLLSQDPEAQPRNEVLDMEWESLPVKPLY
ncbi:hypothetical protein QIJ08_gp1 [ssRNA phage SRR5466725_2]|uniref:Uncharacterized protein n=1 Tax=ssRNA phage SRR5466725_2 TaxID=2786418 RepID=A0A8S5L4Z3_9VIRU|nr:hypothetical protein QIJ08_gp1 [ssRNA phage SRR5466725_2]DAD52405.1 TPA_asm: hypothetical protein [ssRNA phage SRR5466725_2]